MKALMMMVVLASAATATFAEEKKMNFGDADTNSDGAITRAEAASFSSLEASFDEMDANHNGLIERLEFGQTEATSTAAD